MGARVIFPVCIVPVEGSSARGALSGDGTSITSCAMLKGGLRRTREVRTRSATIPEFKAIGVAPGARACQLQWQPQRRSPDGQPHGSPVVTAELVRVLRPSEPALQLVTVMGQVPTCSAKMCCCAVRNALGFEQKIGGSAGNAPTDDDATDALRPCIRLPAAAA